MSLWGKNVFPTDDFVFVRMPLCICSCIYLLFGKQLQSHLGQLVGNDQLLSHSNCFPCCQGFKQHLFFDLEMTVRDDDGLSNSKYAFLVWLYPVYINKCKTNRKCSWELQIIWLSQARCAFREWAVSSTCSSSDTTGSSSGLQMSIESSL